MTDPYNGPIPAAPYPVADHVAGLGTGPLPDIEAVEPDAVELEPVKPSPDAVYNSLNYFDELAIKRCFGAEPLALKKQPGAFMRSLVFSILRKEHGLKDQAAQDLVFQMPNSEVYDHFHIEKPPAKCTDKACPCAEHVDDEDDAEDPTQPLS